MRKHYLDNIRWITALTVVLYHVIYMYNGVQPFGVLGPFRSFQPQDAFQYLVYPWFMALLFVVSGMSARFELDRRSARDFLRRRTVRLLVPSTIGLFVFQWILGLYNMAIGGAFTSMAASFPDTMPAAARTVTIWLIASVSGIGPLWYIQMLWVFSVLLLLFRRISKGRLYASGAKATVPFLLALTPVVWLAAQILNTPVITVYRFGLYGFCFSAGYLIFSHDEVMDRLAGAWLPLVLCSAALCVTYAVTGFGQNYAIEPMVSSPLACVCCWITVLAVLAVMKRHGDRTSPFASWMASKAWGIYIFHYLPLAAAAWHMRQSVPQMPAVACYLICLIAALGGSICLYELIRRIPVLRWCVLGIRKEKRHVQG